MFPSKVMTDNNFCQNDKNNLIYNNYLWNDTIYVNIMLEVNYIASMFSTIEHMYNHNNKYNFGYLPYFLYSMINKENINVNNSDFLYKYIDDLSYSYLHKCYGFDYSIFDVIKIKILIIAIIYNHYNHNDYGYNLHKTLFKDFLEYYNYLQMVYNLFTLYNDINYISDMNDEMKTNVNIIFNKLFDILNDNDDINDIDIDDIDICIEKLQLLFNVKNNNNKSKELLKEIKIVLDIDDNDISNNLDTDNIVYDFIDDIENNCNNYIKELINSFIKSDKHLNPYNFIDFCKKIINNHNKTFKSNLIHNNIFQSNSIYKNTLEIDWILNYINTSVYMYTLNNEYKHILANEDYDEYIGRQHEFLLSNVYSELIDEMIVTKNFKKQINILYSDNNITLYIRSHNNKVNLCPYCKVNIYTLCRLFINEYCKNRYENCQINYTKYNIITDILNKLLIDSKYVLVKIKDISNLLDICYLIDKENYDNIYYNFIYNIYRQLDYQPDDNKNLQTYIYIIQNYCFLFKPLQPLEKYYSYNTNVKSNDIYVDRYKIKNIYLQNKIINESRTGGDLYSIFNGNFFLIESKFYKNPDDCDITKALAQTYLYMNAYFKPLCALNNKSNKYNIVINNSVNINLLYNNYYLCYINSYTNDFVYVNYKDFYEKYHNQFNGYHFESINIYNTYTTNNNKNNGEESKEENSVIDDNVDNDKEILYMKEKFYGVYPPVTPRFSIFNKSFDNINQTLEILNQYVDCDKINNNPDNYKIINDDDSKYYNKLKCLCKYSQEYNNNNKNAEYTCDSAEENNEMDVEEDINTNTSSDQNGRPKRKPSIKLLETCKRELKKETQLNERSNHHTCCCTLKRHDEESYNKLCKNKKFRDCEPK